MMYPFLTLDDSTEIVHSDMRPDNTSYESIIRCYNKIAPEIIGSD